MKTKFHLKPNNMQAVGEWLDQHMTNPLLPEPQRWTLTGGSWPVELEFADEQDAVWFHLKWGDGKNST